MERQMPPIPAEQASPYGPGPVLISLNDACDLTSLSRTAINRWRAEGKFPNAVPLGERRIAFIRAEVIAWVNERIAERVVNQGRAA
jgi:predicted DNA-binding transcriptional regulator AlpA